jgi:hypothetical protein
MTIQLDLFGVLMASSWFSAYLIGVRVLEVITARLRSITFIKSVHTIVFVPLSGLLFVLVYEVATDRITYLSWIAVSPTFSFPSGSRTACSWFTAACLPCHF